MEITNDLSCNSVIQLHGEYLIIERLQITKRLVNLLERTETIIILWNFLYAKDVQYNALSVNNGPSPDAWES